MVRAARRHPQRASRHPDAVAHHELWLHWFDAEQRSTRTSPTWASFQAFVVGSEQHRPTSAGSYAMSAGGVGTCESCPLQQPLTTPHTTIDIRIPSAVLDRFIVACSLLIMLPFSFLGPSNYRSGASASHWACASAGITGPVYEVLRCSSVCVASRCHSHGDRHPFMGLIRDVAEIFDLHLHR